MKLINARVTKYRSIDDSGLVAIEGDVTVLVGQNESGKTAFLQALHKARATENDVKYDVTHDYPRKDYIDYQSQHRQRPEPVLVATYRLEASDVEAINNDIGCEVVTAETTLQLTHNYANSVEVANYYVAEKEEEVVRHLIAGLPLSGENRSCVINCASVRALLDMLETLDINDAETDAVEALRAKYPVNDDWDSPLSYRIWSKYLSPKVPKFLYLDDYRLLPGKANLPEIQRRQNSNQLEDEHKAVLRLLELANVRVEDLIASGGYERLRAQLEGTSTKLTRKIFEYWKSNTKLRVVIDVREDPHDSAPYDSGMNLYLRIHNDRHEVSVPFDQRSKGFIWFFSFLTWFGSAKLHDDGRPIILLLDEPGLNLHALAQADILRYIDDLSKEHQVLYTTHSPFMVESNRLYRVRTVEDRENEGTVVSDTVSKSDAKTLFPLQAALGYSIAQNLFVSKQNLLLEGVADLAYLQTMSAILEANGRTSLREGITLTPVGGLKKVSAFVSLFGANELEMVVLHDFEGREDVNLKQVIQEKLLTPKHIIHYALYRDDTSLPTDVEDLFDPGLYLSYFNKAYSDKLNGRVVKVDDLPSGDRIVERLNRWLAAESIQLKVNGGFNHYLPARTFAAYPPESVGASLMDRFERLFKDVNKLLPD